MANGVHGEVQVSLDVLRDSLTNPGTLFMQEHCYGFSHSLLSLAADPLLVAFSFFFLIFIVIQLQLHAFSPHPSTPPQLNPPPSPTSTLPPGFVHVSFIVVPVLPSSHCPPHPRLLLDCS